MKLSRNVLHTPAEVKNGSAEDDPLPDDSMLINPGFPLTITCWKLSFSPFTPQGLVSAKKGFSYVEDRWFRFAVL
jgi:hypothetical protein